MEKWAPCDVGAKLAAGQFQQYIGKGAGECRKMKKKNQQQDVQF